MRAVVVRLRQRERRLACGGRTYGLGRPIRNLCRRAGKPMSCVLTGPRRCSPRKSACPGPGRSCSAIGRCTGCARGARSRRRRRRASGPAHRHPGRVPTLHRPRRGGGPARGQRDHGRWPGLPRRAQGSVHRVDLGARCSRMRAPRPCSSAIPSAATGWARRDGLIRAKAAAGLAAGLLVVLCIGETEAERAAGQTARGARPAARRGLAGGRFGRAPDRRLRAGLGDRDRADCHDRRHRREPWRDRASASPPWCPRARRCRSSTAARSRPRTPPRSWRRQGVAGVLVGGASLDAAGFWAIYQAGGGA